MTFAKHTCTETRELIAEYKSLKKWIHSAKRKEIKQKIYAIELPLIREKLSTIKDIDEKIISAEYSRVYADTAAYLFSSKEFNSKKFDATMNPSSRKNTSERENIKRLFDMLSNENTSYKTIEKMLTHMSDKEKAAFERICDVDIEIFDSLI